MPAYQWLWSKHDDINHHVKRYSLRELKQLIKNNTNLKIKRISYWNFFLFPLAVIQKKLTKNAELKLLPKPINFIFERIAKFEFSLINKRIRLPFGSSIVAILEKTD